MKRLPQVRRKSVSDQTLHETRPLVAGRSLPTLVTPQVAGLDLIEWTEQNTALVDRLFEEHHALLFRGFTVPADGDARIARFERFVALTSRGERLQYKDRSTPRNSYGDRIYNATVYPPDQRIALHNEGTYWVQFARKIYFGCHTNAATGGETPIGDVGAVYERIDPEVRAPFEELGVLYVRNYNDGLGLTWQEVYQTEEKSEVEAYCAENDIEYEWKGGDRLRTRQRRPAVRVHPSTGEKLWFNHGAFFHVSSLEPSLRATFLEQLGEDELPYNTYYGDGSPIPDEVAAHLRAAYEAEKVVFRWQEGDVALYDNLKVAHAREPFTGERLTLVAMTEATTGAAP